MACGFLTVLPREIRDQVYVYIVAPTGRVILHEDPLSKVGRFSAFPRSPFTTIRFDLLRTCKQIYKEARYAYWHGNVFCIEIINADDRWEPSRLLDSQSHWARLIQRVEIRSWFAQNCELVKAYSLILHISSWARDGALNELIFNISGMGTLSRFGEMVEGRCRKKGSKSQLSTAAISTEDTTHEATSWNKLCWLFGGVGAGEKTGMWYYLEGVQKKINIQLEAKYTSGSAQKRWLNDHPPEDCEETLAELNRFLGGELYVDGVLCYRDQVQLRETFTSWEKTLGIHEVITNFDDFSNFEANWSGNLQPTQLLALDTSFVFIDPLFPLSLEGHQVLGDALHTETGMIDWTSWNSNCSSVGSVLAQEPESSFFASEPTLTKPHIQTTPSSISDYSTKSISISDITPPSDLIIPAPNSTSSPRNRAASPHSYQDPSAKVKKRTLNTIAARRYRQKKVDQVKDLETALKDTEAERDELKLKVARLEAENGILRGLVTGK